MLHAFAESTMESEVADTPHSSAGHSVQQEVQEFFDTDSFSQVFNDRSPAKSRAQIVPFSGVAASKAQHEPVINRNSAFQRKDLEEQINKLKKALSEKNKTIAQQKFSAESQTVYSYTFLHTLRNAVENCAHVTDAETVLRAVLGAHGVGSSDFNHLLDCLMQTLLMWLPTEIAKHNELRNLSVASRVNDAVLFLVLFTRNEEEALRVVQKYGVFVWRAMSFLGQPVSIAAGSEESSGSVVLHAAEVQNGLLSILQHLFMHKSSCRALLNDTVTVQQFPGSSEQYEPRHRKGAEHKQILLELIPILARIAMQSRFVRAAELSLTTLTTIYLQIDLEWAFSKTETGQSKGDDSTFLPNIETIRRQFRLALACSLTPGNIHRLQEQWGNVTCITTALDALANAAQIPVTSLVVPRQENNDPDTEVWQQYEFEEPVEKPVVVPDVQNKPLYVEELERPVSSLVPSVLDKHNVKSAVPAVVTSTAGNFQTSNHAANTLPSVTITAPRTAVARPLVQNPQQVANAQQTKPAANSVRKRLFYDDDAGDTNSDSECGVVITAQTPALNQRQSAVLLPPTPASERPTVTYRQNILPASFASTTSAKVTPVIKPPPSRTAPSVNNIKSPAVNPLIYRKTAEKSVLDSRSPTNARVIFRNAVGSQYPRAPSGHGSQDIRKFFPSLNIAFMSPQQEAENRQKRDELQGSVAAPLSPSINAGIDAARVSYSKSNNSPLKSSAANSARRSTFQRSDKKWTGQRNARQLQNVSPMHARIGPRVLGSGVLPRAQRAPPGFVTLESFPASVSSAADNHTVAAAAAESESDNAWDGYTREEVEEMFATESFDNSASSENAHGNNVGASFNTDTGEDDADISVLEQKAGVTTTKFVGALAQAPPNPKIYEFPARRIPVDYQVDTVHEVEDDGSKSNG